MGTGHEVACNQLHTLNPPVHHTFSVVRGIHRLAPISVTRTLRSASARARIVRTIVSRTRLHTPHCGWRFFQGVSACQRNTFIGRRSVSKSLPVVRSSNNELHECVDERRPRRQAGTEMHSCVIVQASGWLQRRGGRWVGALLAAASSRSITVSLPLPS